VRLDGTPGWLDGETGRMVILGRQDGTAKRRKGAAANPATVLRRPGVARRITETDESTVGVGTQSQ
jgi:hypothetical protein